MELRVEDCLGCPSNILSYLSLVCTRLVWALPLSASDPHISPPTGGRWQHVKRVSAVGLTYSTLKLKCWGISASTTRQSRRRPFPDLCLGLPEIRKKRAGMKTELRWIYSIVVQYVLLNVIVFLSFLWGTHCIANAAHLSRLNKT